MNTAISRPTQYATPPSASGRTEKDSGNRPSPDLGLERSWRGTIRLVSSFLPLLLLSMLLGAIDSPAQTFTRLVSFDDANGAEPYLMSLVQGTDGNLYGTTQNGGAASDGTVFKVTPTGTLSTLHNFCSKPGCTDGLLPSASLALATNGKFYGTTYGDANNEGTVFSITSGGKLTTLHAFDGTDGAHPSGTLVQGTDGKFYGTTAYGGTGDFGTVFAITAGGKLTTLHSFDNTDGAYPYGGLVQATNGVFYGTTEQGGDNSNGTVFSITAAGAFSSLHSFDYTDGAFPYDGLVQATNGNFYGTTESGGTNSAGTVFSITSAGALTTLYNFCSQPNCSDGFGPDAGLTQATNGSFYGTTVQGGVNYGTIFSITAGGAFNSLHSFDSTDGAYPYGGFVQATNGTLYGTTGDGGDEGYGTFFSVAVGLNPFVETLPTSGKVGAAVTILGTDLTGATSVTFNGTLATFTVQSNTEIKTTVPHGATTGNVEVTTPSGTLTSNVNFRVP